MSVAVGWRPVPLAVLVVGVLLLWSVTPTYAANFEVNRTDDLPDASAGGTCDALDGTGGDQCTLRAAIQAANAIGGEHTIELPEGTYTLTRANVDNTAFEGDLDVLTKITITGDGAASTIIQASTTSAATGVDRIFEVLGTGNLTLSGVTLRHGSPADGLGGGAIRNAGILALDRVIVTANSSIQGGGVDALGETTITNSTIHTNTATSTGGGGLAVSSAAGITTLTNVTLSGNTAPAGNGGGLFIGSGATATLTNVTVTGNSAQVGGGIRRVAGSVILRNTIVASNISGAGANCVGNPGTIVSEGFNLVFPGTGCGTSAGQSDQIDVDPVLGPLANNGGPTPTHALGTGSGAIDRGNTAQPLDGTNGRCASRDQRGAARPSDGDLNTSAVCDIGAFEVSVFRVNQLPDDDDLVAGDGLCDSAGAILFQCTLRAAIQEANALGGLHTIKLSGETYTLTQPGNEDAAQNGDLDITASITIVGEGAASTIVQAHQSSASSAVDRVFQVTGGGSLTMSGVTVRHGKPAGGAPGGGIVNAGTLLLDRVVVTGNSADTGGGISVQGLTTITNSAITTNSATSNSAGGGGGGIIIQAGGADTILTNVTLSGNTAPTGEGGGLRLGVSATATLTNVTVTGNSAVSGAGIRRTIGTVRLRNTIVASNTGGNCNGTVTSEGFNLVFPGTGCGMSAGVSDQIDVDPKLGPLALNSPGTTQTHALGAGSGAVDRGNPAPPLDATAGRCAATDQRGTARPIDGDLDGTARCDIGAYELPKPPDLTIALTHTGTFTAGQNGVYTVTVSNSAVAAPTSATIVVNVILPAGLTFVSGTGTGWGCGTGPGLPVVCTTGTALVPGASSAIMVTVTAAQAAVPGVTPTATVAVASELTALNNSASDPTTVIGSCGPRPNVGLQVTQTGPGTGPGRLRATLNAQTSTFDPSNGITKVKILKVTNAALDEIGGQNNLTSGEVTFANVPTTSFIVRRLSSATPPREAFTVEIEVTDACGAWKTTVGGGPNVP